MNGYLIIDTESDGLFDWKLPADALGQPRLAEIGMIFVSRDFKIEREEDWLIRPEGWKFDDRSEAARVNGLTHNRLTQDGIPVGDALSLYCSGIDAGRVIVGFNVTHDLKLMRAENRRAKIDDRYMRTKSLCMMWSTRSIVGALDARGKVKIPSLQEACTFFGIEQPKAHSALADAHSAYQLMLKLVERGALPEPKSPYDKKPKKAKAAKEPKVGLPGDDPELDDSQAEIPL